MKDLRHALLIMLLAAAGAAYFLSTLTFAQTSTNQAKEPQQLSTTFSRRHCLFILGLPGDQPHRQAFREIADTIQGQLTQRGFLRENVTVLTPSPPQGSDNVRSARKESIAETVSHLVESLQEADSLWVIFLGHADHDGEHARFHLPGPDLRAIDYADLFKDLACEQQVFWLTMSSSGWFTEPLSRDKRIVITATTRDAEPNETEFPAAFAAALSSSLSEIDRDGDGEVSVLEIFARTYEIVEATYDSDDRAPTEHATMDDNGDGRGTEWKEILAEQKRIAELSEDAPVDRLVRSPRVDGLVAATTIVPKRDESPAAAPPSITAETDNFDIE